MVAVRRADELAASAKTRLSVDHVKEFRRVLERLPIKHQIIIWLVELLGRLRQVWVEVVWH
jgi:hypothetical protein